MAGIPKAKFEASLDTTKIKQGSKQAVTSFEKMATGAKSSMGKIDAKAKGTGNDLKRVGTEGKQAGAKVKAGAEKGAQGMNKLGIEAKKTSKDIGAVSISVLGLGASVTGLSDTIFGMKEKMVALERSAYGLEQTTEDVKRMQEDFDEAIKNGTLAGREYERAVKDLEMAYKDMAVEQKEIQAETEAMNSEWISFAVNTATTVVFAVTTIKTAFDAETLSKLKSVAVTKLAILANKAFIGTLWGIAKHPVFLVVAGALAVWESNLFGLRSEIEAWSGIADLSILSNVEKALGGGIPEASAQTIDSLDNVEEKIRVLETSMEETSSGMDKTLIPSIATIGTVSDKSSTKVDHLSDSLDKLKKKRDLDYKDSVESELKFVQQVARIRKLNASSQAMRTGLASNVAWRNNTGGSFGFGSDSGLLRGAKGSDHWNGGRSLTLGGQAGQAISDQQAYNASISGHDNNSTAGWSGKALDTLSIVQQRVAQLNREHSARHERQKQAREQAKISTREFGREWGLDQWTPIFKTYKLRNFGMKAFHRNLGSRVNKVKQRIKILQDLGYGAINNPEALARAEEQLRVDREGWVTQSGMSLNEVTQMHTAGRKSDIFNIINYRQRLGLISSGVI